MYASIEREYITLEMDITKREKWIKRKKKNKIM